MSSTRYWIDRDPDGKIAHLVRIRDVPGEGLWTEYFRGGHWNEDSAAYRYLMDPLLGDEITQQEAQAAVRELGHQWPDGPERDLGVDRGP